MDRRSGNKRKIDKNRWRGGCDEECKKILERKRKIIVVLVVMVSFVSRSGMVSDEEGTCLSII